MLCGNFSKKFHLALKTAVSRPFPPVDYGPIVSGDQMKTARLAGRAVFKVLLFYIFG
jgi:hypothetical protein